MCIRDSAGTNNKEGSLSLLFVIPTQVGMLGAETKNPAEAGLFATRHRLNYCAVTTLTVRRLFGPLVVNSTLPLTSANRV